MSTALLSPSPEEDIELTSQAETEPETDLSRPIVLAELPVYDLDSQFLEQFEPRYRIQLQHMLHTASRTTLLRARNEEYLQLYDTFIGQSQARREAVGRELHRELLLAHRTLMDDYSRVREQLRRYMEGFDVLRLAWGAANQGIQASLSMTIPADIPEPSSTQSQLGNSILLLQSPLTHMSDFEEEDDNHNHQATRALTVPGPNASNSEILATLKDAQLLLGQALRDNRELEAKLHRLEARRPGRKKGTTETTIIRGEDKFGYQEHLLRWAKKWCIMVYPWIQVLHFRAKISSPLTLSPPGEVFRVNPPSVLFRDYLTATLYEHIPAPFHDLIDTEKFTELAANFCRQANSQRSTALNIIQTNLPTLLTRHGYDLQDIQQLLLYGDEKEGTKINIWPPVLYHGLKKGGGLFLNRLLPLMLRAVVFGPTSLEDDGKRKPQKGTLGSMWGLREVSFGSMAFTGTAVIFTLFWMQEHNGHREKFEEIGTASQFSFLKMWMRLRHALATNAESPGIRKAVRLWNQIVFEGVTSVTPLANPQHEGDYDEEIETEEALAGLNDEYESGEEDRPEGFDWYSRTPKDDHPANAVQQHQPQAHPLVRPQASASRPSQASTSFQPPQAPVTLVTTARTETRPQASSRPPQAPVTLVTTARTETRPQASSRSSQAPVAPATSARPQPPASSRPLQAPVTLVTTARAETRPQVSSRPPQAPVAPVTIPQPETHFRPSASFPATRRRASPPPLSPDGDESPIRPPRLGRRVRFLTDEAQEAQDEADEDELPPPEAQEDEQPPLSPLSPLSESSSLDAEETFKAARDASFNFEDDNALGYDEIGDDNVWVGIERDLALEKGLPKKGALKKTTRGKSTSSKAPAKQTAAKQAAVKQTKAATAQKGKATLSKKAAGKLKASEPISDVDPDSLPYPTRNRTQRKR
ncbi:hypothetical protein C8R43DRAFT_942927 [Mycena crocata]|nr:hypothetical protein C8R43DRAFT_942927 [Mycena crocata]